MGFLPRGQPDPLEQAKGTLEAIKLSTMTLCFLCARGVALKYPNDSLASAVHNCALKKYW